MTVPFDVNQAIRRFAPIVWFHSRESYFPSNVSWFLRRAILRLHRSRKNDLNVRTKGKLTTHNLSIQRKDGKYSGSRTKNNFFLQIPNDSQDNRTRKGKLSSAICYAHVQRVGTTNMWNIVYLFFYPYSGNISSLGNFAHEGDWEHIKVRVDNKARHIIKIFFSAHDNEGRWYQHKSIDPAKGFTTKRNHPIVFSALHSHASYTRSGKQHRPRLPDDHTEQAKGPWKTWKSVVDIGDWAHPLNGQMWLKYSGRWGEIGNLTFTTGPYGPAQKEWWKENRFYPPLPGSGRLVFFKNNGCKGSSQETTDLLGQSINCKNRKHWKNDYYRSLELIEVRKGAKIYLYDSPKGKNSDDWTIITVKRQMPKICISTFQRNRNDSNVRVQYNRKNGLDGKVSKIVIA